MHCTRAKWQSIERASALASAVLPDAGIVLDENVALGQQRDEQMLERLTPDLHGLGDVLGDPPSNAAKVSDSCCATGVCSPGSTVSFPANRIRSTSSRTASAT